MNHIKELTIQRDGLSKELAAYHQAIEELRSYLMSDKFSVDTTVQVKDVCNRLWQARDAALDARNEHDNAAYKAEREREQARQDKPKQHCEMRGCNYFGRDWEDVDGHGFTMRLCKKCYSAGRHLGEVD